MATMLFFDEEGNDITDLVVLAEERAPPWLPFTTFVYQHPVLGDIPIGCNTSGDISMNEEYTYEMGKSAGD